MVLWPAAQEPTPQQYHISGCHNCLYANVNLGCVIAHSCLWDCMWCRAVCSCSSSSMLPRQSVYKGCYQPDTLRVTMSCHVAHSHHARGCASFTVVPPVSWHFRYVCVQAVTVNAAEHDLQLLGVEVNRVYGSMHVWQWAFVCLHAYSDSPLRLCYAIA